MKWRLALAFVMVCACFANAHAGPLSDAPVFPLELQVTGAAPSPDKIAIGLKMINHSDHEIAIQRGIEIDSLIKFKWVARMQIEAVASCKDFDSNYHWQAPVRVTAGATLDIVPWDGWMCGRCEACAKNAPLGTGTYQFVVVTAEGQRLPSPSFILP